MFSFDTIQKKGLLLKLTLMLTSMMTMMAGAIVVVNYCRVILSKKSLTIGGHFIVHFIKYKTPLQLNNGVSLINLCVA